MRIKTEDKIVQAVLRKMDERSLIGQKKYGATMMDEIEGQKKDLNRFLVDVQEEAGELAKALLEDDQPEVIDAIGDMVVVLTNLAHLRGVNIETCISSAYNEIKGRTGQMINGTFVKDEN